MFILGKLSLKFCDYQFNRHLKIIRPIIRNEAQIQEEQAKVFSKSVNNQGVQLEHKYS